MNLLRFSAPLFILYSKEKERQGRKKEGEILPVLLLSFFLVPHSHLLFPLPFPGIDHLCKEREGVITSKKVVGDLFKPSIRHAAPEQVARIVKYYLHNILTESYV